jgi:hypothetical protein
MAEPADPLFGGVHDLATDVHLIADMLEEKGDSNAATLLRHFLRLTSAGALPLEDLTAHDLEALLERVEAGVWARRLAYRADPSLLERALRVAPRRWAEKQLEALTHGADDPEGLGPDAPLVQILLRDLDAQDAVARQVARAAALWHVYVAQFAQTERVTAIIQDGDEQALRDYCEGAAARAMSTGVALDDLADTLRYFVDLVQQ